MKKSLLLLPLTLLTCLTMTGCNEDQNSITRITYGTYAETTYREINDFNDLVKKFTGDENKENFLLVAPYDTQSGCACWTNFKTIINNYVKEEHVVVYMFERIKIINSTNQSKAEQLGITLPSKGETNFYIINKGKVAKEFIYSTGNDFFHDKNNFKNELNKYIKAPQMYYVNPEDLSTQMENKKALVHYIWNFCPDCQYCSPNCLMPYMDANDINKPFYVVDLGPLVLADGTFNKTNETYVSYLKEWKLSKVGDEKLGYGRGFVPTTQYWENGELKDASVYFNDTIEKVEGKYVITDSFYTEERKANLHYLESVETKVLKGIEIPEADMNIQDEENFSWKQNKAAEYHNKFLESFLDTYAK